MADVHDIAKGTIRTLCALCITVFVLLFSPVKNKNNCVFTYKSRRQTGFVLNTSVLPSFIVQNHFGDY